MSELKTIIQKIGKEKIMNELKIGIHSIYLAQSNGVAPAKWWGVMKKLGDEKGVSIPDHIFNFATTCKGEK